MVLYPLTRKSPDHALGMEGAIAHCATGASVWEWASNVPEGQEPDVVLGCAGDIPTLETVAAAHWLRENAPELRIRVVNVVDLMALFPREFHSHGMDETRFVELFTANRPVVFAFHGYQRAIHEIVHGHVDVDRFHVRGFNEQGTTTTPFDMTVLNGMSRYHLAAEALRRSRRKSWLAPARPHTDPGLRVRGPDRQGHCLLAALPDRRARDPRLEMDLLTERRAPRPRATVGQCTWGPRP
jgi:phosphoketolase